MRSVNFSNSSFILFNFYRIFNTLGGGEGGLFFSFPEDHHLCPSNPMEEKKKKDFLKKKKNFFHFLTIYFPPGWYITGLLLSTILFFSFLLFLEGVLLALQI